MSAFSPILNQSATTGEREKEENMKGMKGDFEWRGF